MQTNETYVNDCAPAQDDCLGNGPVFLG